jgi:hypothetical protein
MITIWVKRNENLWELVEELQDDLALAQRIVDLRMDGSDYRAEKVTELSSTILDV